MADVPVMQAGEAVYRADLEAHGIKLDEMKPLQRKGDGVYEGTFAPGTYAYNSYGGMKGKTADGRTFEVDSLKLDDGSTQISVIVDDGKACIGDEITYQPTTRGGLVTLKASHFGVAGDGIDTLSATGVMDKKGQVVFNGAASQFLPDGGVVKDTPGAVKALGKLEDRVRKGLLAPFKP